MYIRRYDIKARSHLACDLNGITQLGDWCMDTYNNSPVSLNLTGSWLCVSIHQSHFGMPFISQAHAFSLYKYIASAVIIFSLSFQMGMKPPWYALCEYEHKHNANQKYKNRNILK